MSHHIIEFKKVSFTYPDGTGALSDISFRITHGEAVGLAGANGAGKSTLLLQMNGYLLPGAGTVNIGGLELNRHTRQAIRKTVGTVFQNPDDQLFMPTVGEDVAFGPLNLGLAPERVAERVEEALRMVGCRELMDRPPHHLSGGQKRAVSIATVLAMEPDILVMDEPSAGLDPKSRRALIGLLRGFSHSKLIASHDLDFILETCHRCLIIKGGRITADGPAREILTDRALLEANDLELPLSRQCHEAAERIMPDHSGAAG